MLNEARIAVHTADGKPAGTAPETAARAMAAAGLGFLVKSRAGRILRFIRTAGAAGRVYFDAREGVSATREGSRTTAPLRAGGRGARGAGQLLGAPQTVQRHRSENVVHGGPDAPGLTEVARGPLRPPCLGASTCLGKY
jgi:hypothetical protein